MHSTESLVDDGVILAEFHYNTLQRAYRQREYA